MLFVYNIFLVLFKVAIRIISLYNSKAKMMLIGRKNIFETIKKHHQKSDHCIWMHCASVGEYEQGLPLLKALKNKAKCSIIVTFFSSSGYNTFKKNDYVDEVYYLPFEGNNNASTFIELIQPTKVFFVKYELWYYYLVQLNARNISVYMISMYVPNNHYYTKWFGVLHRKMLSMFTHIFVQDKPSLDFIKTINKNCSITGDTRYTRVFEVANENFEDEIIENFCRSNKILVAGSTWLQDEMLLKDLLERLDENWKLVLVPHEINDKHIHDIEKIFTAKMCLYNKYQINKKVLIVNKMGLLKYIYRYADIAYIGGGFGAGIHNILEALVYSKPVIHGPNCERFLESKIFQELAAVQIVHNYDEGLKSITHFESNKNLLKKNIEAKFEENLKSVEIIMHTI